MVAYRRRRPRHVLFSSATDDWPTPWEFFTPLHEHYRFTLDAAASTQNAKCEAYFTKDDDSLSQDWTGRVWLNPPYGRRIGLWIAKAWESSQTTADLVVTLVPGRTDTRWWHSYVAPVLDEHPERVHFVKGRLCFGDRGPAPFPSVVVEFRNDFRVTKLPALEALQ